MQSITLGGSTGAGGGSGGPPGGFVGYLNQSQVAGDTDEYFLETSGSVVNLLSNLDNARAWLEPAHNFWAKPDTTIPTRLRVSSGSWHYSSGVAPMTYGGGYTTTVSAPSSQPRIDLLTIDNLGNLKWTQGSEAASPSPPAYVTPTSGSMPLWLVYARTSGSMIQPFGRNDGSNHYIYRDLRPFLDWGIGGAGGGGASLDSTSPQDVGAAAVVGTSGSAAHGDHVHRGVASVSQQPSGSYAYGNIVLRGSTNIAVTQSSGSFDIASSGSFLPQQHDINGTYHAGFPLTTDHGGTGTNTQPTAGAIPIGKTDGTYAPNHLIAGSNVSISNSSGSVTISSTGGLTTFDSASPQDVGITAIVGTSGSPPHADHVHRGVHGIFVAPNTDLFGDIELVGSTNISIAQSSGSFTFSSSGSFLPQVHDINGAYHNGLPLRIAGGGLGTTTTPTAGAIPIGTSSGIYTPNHLIAGANVTITNSSGSVSIASSGGGHTIQNEGVSLAPETYLDFVGTAVEATDIPASTKTKVTIQYSEPVTNGSVGSPELIFSNGDVVIAFFT